ncbi:MAG: hypothetical protein N0C86_19580, partial [Candidatus Thiodiazotropha taylori]|nr:hypothetical protein [Candidatus Thiodiazotropha taylori]MCW4328203.1 hypothetical protein [Candidatus Thiodiazotropha taylori]
FLWQKECLLQLGINEALSRGESHIVVTDADVLFETPYSWDRIMQTFEAYDWFQPYETASLEYSDGALDTPSAMSFADPVRYGAGHPGSCWAGTSAFFRSVPLYPYALLGGGDVVMTHLLATCWKHGASSKRFADLAAYICDKALFPQLLPSILEWAKLAGHFTFRYGHTTGVHIRALDHGSRKSRGYNSRYSHWLGTKPIPQKDYFVGPQGLLTWRRRPNKWEDEVVAYFRSREQSSATEPLTAGA